MSPGAISGFLLYETNNPNCLICLLNVILSTSEHIGKLKPTRDKDRSK